MILNGRKHIRSIIYKYKRFHIWFNKRMDKYFHNSIIVDMKPYNYKVIHKMQKQINDHWSNLIQGILLVLFTIISFIIVYILIR